MTFDPPEYDMPLSKHAATPVAEVTTPTPPPTIRRVPSYMRDVYGWAYLHPVGQRVFDRGPMVTAILQGNASRLMRAVEDELEPGDDVLQAACVYGDFSMRLARRIGAEGRLDIIDVAANQVRATRRKMMAFPQAQVRRADAAAPGRSGVDVAISFFLLHEVPADHRVRVVESLLRAVRPGGKVVFVDYHRPAWWHPMGPVMAGVFHWLEPFARDLWRKPIRSDAPAGAPFLWQQTTYFGGMYQKVVAVRQG